ncbi:hypothetical protein GMDG_05433 [Pseudogymnoascus destructans 20631-21]|uniref:Uncharacterized protein n=1 Tax=Pseudogymnoascus destructans (strain ATCC MYA-4855 / 20631-21) TaxID=658429 RepID=L8FP89_PSED2|nr:hypothetical protein GMDG_05433 [Pseudogymnoascus destructans 20631-21]
MSCSWSIRWFLASPALLYHFKPLYQRYFLALPKNPSTISYRHLTLPPSPSHPLAAAAIPPIPLILHIYLTVAKMGSTQAILSILILILVIARNHFPGRLLALLHRQGNLLTHPLPAFPLIHIPPSRPPRPPALNYSPLGRLAPETIQLIASFLPPSAAASFASTCLAIRLMTGTQYLALLCASPAELLMLLEYITVDLPLDPITEVPPRLLCLYCARLVPYMHLCTASPTPLCQQAYAQFWPYVPPNFRHQIFHTAMTMCRHGRSPWALLGNLKPRSTTTTRYDGGITSQTAWEYRIIHGSPYQRTRVSMILPREDANYNPTVQPCPHYASYHKAMGRKALEVQDLVRQTPKLRACSDMVSCRHCRTVLRVGCRKFRGLGLGLFVTWWMDVGDGGWIMGRKQGLGWKDVRYTRKWAMNYFEHMCSTQRYFDFEGMDSLKDRRELLATARGVLKG